MRRLLGKKMNIIQEDGHKNDFCIKVVLFIPGKYDKSGEF